MRVHVAAAIGSTIVATTDLASAAANPAWDGLGLWGFDGEAFPGYPLPEGAEPVARPAPGVSTAEDLLAYAHEAHLAAEAAGTSWKGWPVMVNERAMTRAVGEVTAVLIGAREDGDPWSFGDGVSRGLSNEDLKALSLRMRTHVGVCLAVYTGVAAGIAAGQVSATAQIDAAFAGVDALVLAGAAA